MRDLLVCGVAGPVAFLAGSAVLGALVPGYDPVAQTVSELSLTAAGPVMKTLFLVSGLLVVLGALGVRGAPPARRAPALPVVLGVLGACLAASGVFDTDPAVLFTASSAEGRVHALLGAAVFTALPVAAALGARRPGGRRGTRTACAVCAVLLVAGDVLLKLGEVLPGPLMADRGVVQRAVLVLGLGQVAAAALRLLHAGRRGQGAARPPLR